MIKKFLGIMFCIFYTSVLFSTVGSLDSNFGTGGIVTTDIASLTADAAYASVIQSDGKIVVAGLSGNDFALSRYNIDGSLDITFGSLGKVITDVGGIDVVNALAIQRDGKILAGGGTGSDLFVLVRYNANGSLDTSFGLNGKSTYDVGLSGASIRGMAIQPVNNKIIIAGSVDESVIAVMRINMDGNQDITFNSGSGHPGLIVTSIGTATTIYDVALQSDGKIVVAGTSDYNVLVARYLEDGSGLDTVGFNSGGTPGYILANLDGMPAAYGVGLQSDNKIVVAGYSYDGSTERIAVARFLTTGVLDSYANNNTSPFGTGGTGLQTGYIFYGFATFTSAVARDMVIQQDDKIVVAGTYENNFIIARFLSDGSAIDTTFDTVGYVITDIGSSSTDEAHAIVMQDDNKFIVAGTTDSNSGDFAVVRYNGDAVPQGVIDTTYDVDGFVTYPTDNDSTHMPQVKALQVQADNSVLVVTENLAVVTKSQLVQLAADGTVLTTAIDIAQTGVRDVIMDGSGRVLVVGSNGSNGWIARYTIASGAPGTFSLDATFNSGAILVETTNSTQILKVAENSLGKIIVAAKNGSSLLLLSYNSDGSVDTSFGVGGTGYYLVSGNASFYDMVIDANNYIYVAHSGSMDYQGSSNCEVRKVVANGTGLDTGYGTSGVLISDLDTPSYNAPRITLYNTDKICIGSSQPGNDGIYFQGFAADGVTQDGYFAPNASTHLLSGVVITQIQADTHGSILFTGYDDNYVFVSRAEIEVSSDFDPTFAPHAQVPGILKVMYNNNNPTDFVNGSAGTTPHRVSNAVSIGGNGNIIFGGYEAIDATNTVSFISRVLGDQTPYTQVPRYPVSEISEVDVTFGTNGILSLLDVAGVDSGLGIPVAMHVYDSGDDVGKMLILIANGSDTTVIKLNANYTADTSFGSGTGAIVLSGLTNPTAIQVDFDGKILVSAGTTGSGSGQLQRVLADGSAVDLTFVSPLDNGYVVRIQSLTRIILAGEKDGKGCLVGINSVDGTVDVTFGTNGYYTQAATTTFADAFVDSNNNIVVAYKNSSNEVLVDRVLPEGSGLDSTFVFGTVIASVSSALDIRLACDKDDKIIVVARNSDGNFVASRYAANGTDDVGPVTITLSATSVLEKVLTLNNGSTLILGYNTSSKSIVVYLNSSFVLNSAFGKNGIASGTIGNISQFNAIDVISDPAIMVAGYDSVTTGVALTQLLHDVTVTKISQNQSTLGGSGTVDATLGTTGISFFAQAGSDVASLQVARAIALQGNNRYVVALDGRDPDDSPASRIFLSVFNADGNLDTDFSSDGQIELPTQYDNQYVKDMVVFATTGGVYKAIIAGYVASTTLSVDNSLLIQFNLTTASLDTLFGGLYGDAVGTVSGHTAQIHTVARQSLGRIIAGGEQVDGSGVLLGYSSLGRLDKSFGVDGYYVQPERGIYTQVVDASDNIIIAYDNGSGQVIIARVLADGSGLDATFNTGGTPGYVATGITGVVTVDQIRLAVDVLGRIIVVAVNNSGVDFVIKRYEVDGSSSVSQTIAGATDLGTAVTSLTLGQLLVDENGKAIIVGNAVDAGGTWMITVRTTTGITALDSTFNNTGYIKYKVDEINTSRQLLDALLHLEGRVIAVGSEVVDIL